MVQRADANKELPVLDAWSALSFKRVLGNKANAPASTYMVPSWVGIHGRRLQAYDLLDAIDRNVARFFMAAHIGEAQRANHREYGDGSLLVTSKVAALLGEDQRVVTVDADKYDPDAEPEVDEADVPDPENPDDVPGGGLVPTDAEAQQRAKDALEFQEWAQQWATDERLRIKMRETEPNAVKFGDGVYALAWSDDKQRARLRVFDPGAYFPVLDDGNEDDYPRKVHVAWEIVDPKETVSDQTKRRVHRLTWELVETEEQVQYPWNDAPSGWRCLYSDAIFEYDAGGKVTVDDFTDTTAKYATTFMQVDGVRQLVEIRQLDLGLDFIPVVHIPNTVALLNHYGESELAPVAQILDDLANSDTDVQKAGATVAKPPIGLAGARLARDNQGNPIAPKWEPGEVWELAENGKLSTVDTSGAVKSLLELGKALLERLSINGRMPGTFIGRTEGGEIKSGIHLALTFGPLQTWVQDSRLIREEKYALVFKFAHRMHLAARVQGTPAKWIHTTVEFGRFIPADVRQAVQDVRDLLAAKAISRETGVRMLQDVGLPIDDVAAEIMAIQSTDYDGAEALLAATGSKELVAEYLGIEIPEAPEPQRVVVREGLEVPLDEPPVPPAPPAA